MRTCWCDVMCKSTYFRQEWRCLSPDPHQQRRDWGAAAPRAAPLPANIRWKPWWWTKGWRCHQIPRIEHIFNSTWFTIPRYLYLANLKKNKNIFSEHTRPQQSCANICECSQIWNHLYFICNHNRIVGILLPFVWLCIFANLPRISWCQFIDDRWAQDADLELFEVDPENAHACGSIREGSLRGHNQHFR